MKDNKILNKEEAIKAIQDVLAEVMDKIKINNENLDMLEVFHNTYKYLANYDKNNEILNEYIYKNKEEYYR